MVRYIFKIKLPLRYFIHSHAAPMITIYRLLFFPFFVVLLLKNLPKMIKRGGYRKYILHRLGLLPKIKKSSKKRIWIQAVSVGEVHAVRRLIKRLSRDFEVVLTTTTTTAREIIAEKLSKNLLFFGYFPWDFWLFSKIAWNRIRPDVAILVESELWPEHLYQAKKRNVPIFLVNARLSDRSFRRYALCHRLASKLWQQLDGVAASSKENRRKIARFFHGELHCFGNMKFDSVENILSEEEKNTLRKDIGFCNESFVILGCSTWSGEETMLLETLYQLRRNGMEKNRDYKLLLVPRHAERREEIIEEIKRTEFSYCQRSECNATHAVDVCLADTTGELGKLVQIANLAFIGKSLDPHKGGQSPLDAAMAGLPIVYGDRMTNFRDLCAEMESAESAVKVGSKEAAIAVLTELAFDKKKRKQLANNVTRWLAQNQGASEKTYRWIAFHMKSTDKGSIKRHERKTQDGHNQ